MTAMKIIYNCYGGSHSSITAAAIHLGLLPDTYIPAAQEFLKIPYYDAQIGKDHGRIRFMGFDEFGNKVYITSKRNLGYNYEKIMRKILTLTEVPQEEYLFINTMPYVNILMVIGGYTSQIGRAHV